MNRKHLKKIITLIVAFAIFTSVIPTAFAAAQLPFTDMPRAWTFSNGYYSVKSLYEQGIVEGKTSTKFAPNDTLTREEAAKIIVKAAGAPLSGAGSSFNDVEAGSWYESYVNAACSAGLMQGAGDGSFGIGSNITRQDAAVIVANMANYKSIALEETERYTIADADSISDYALDAVTTLVNMNVADLNGNNCFKPADDITRLGFCVFIDRVLISDVNAYDDHLQDIIPVEKSVLQYPNVEVAFEDFEDDNISFDLTHTGVDNVPAVVDTTVGKDSSRSIKHSAGGSASTENIFFDDVEAGTQYCISWDIKTEGMENASVRIGIEWYNASNTNIGGGYIYGGDITKNTDWTKQTYVSGAISAESNPEFVRMAIQIKDANTADSNSVVKGNVWIDNIKIFKVIYNPLTTVLDKPAYKGLITDADGRGDIRVTSYINGLGTFLNEEDYKLTAEISPITGGKISNVIRHSEISDISDRMDISFSSGELAIGDYDLAIRLININDNTELDVNHWILRKREADYKPKYYFDDYGRVVKDGEPYFGIGAYARSFKDMSVLTDFANKPIDFIIENSFSSHWENYENYEKFAQSGISVMLNTESVYKDAFRKQLQHSDISTIASERVVLERIVEDLDLKNLEAHMGYQINNEAPYLQWSERLTWQNQILSEIDMDHLTYGTGGGGKTNAIGYSGSHDVYAPDLYPITGNDGVTDPIWEVYEHVKGFSEGIKNRPVWSVVQISDLGPTMGGTYANRKRGPNITELRNMAWQSVCAGAQAVIWYSHFHLDNTLYDPDGTKGMRDKADALKDVTDVSEELAKYKDVILSVEDVPDIHLSAAIPDRFAHLVKRHNGKTYIFLVNMSQGAQNVSFSLSDAKSVLGAESQKTYAIGDDGSVKLSVDGLGVEILIVDQIDQPSYDCELKNIHFGFEEDNFFVSQKDGVNYIHIPADAEYLCYNADIHPDARIIVNGCPNDTEGTIGLAGRDEIRFTVISEDGKHHTQTRYTLVRK